MEPEPAHLPPLSPADEALLADAFALYGDLGALAQHTRRSIFELLRWATRPDVAAYLQVYQDHLASARRQRAAAALESLAETTTDPIELRRLITLILRHCTARSRPARAADPAAPVAAPRTAASRPAPAPQPHPTPGATPAASAPEPRPATPAPEPAPPAAPVPPSLSPTLEHARTLLRRAGLPDPLTDEQLDAELDRELDALADEAPALASATDTG